MRKMENENDWLCRERALIGEEATERLRSSCVAVFGCGGVGGYIIEVLARAGVGRIAVIDFDTVSVSNRNRQILADTETVGEKKTAVAAARILRINPEADVRAIDQFITPEKVPPLLAQLRPDAVADAVDNVTAKLAIVTEAPARDIAVISCMGTGNKRDAGRLRIADLAETSVCPLARVMRRELKLRGIVHTPVLFSDETPARADGQKGNAPASVSYVPAAAGILIGGWIIQRLAFPPKTEVPSE